jgi:hypothetical protein
MSTVLTIDEAPHIVRYGMHSAKAGSEKCWIHFYRSGVRFIIHVSHANVATTRFAEKWLPLLEEPKKGDLPRDWVKRWQDLCTLVITACIGTIRPLVAGDDGSEDHGRWKTLEGYLNTPSYELELVAVDSTADLERTGEKPTAGDDNNDGVMVRILKGPEYKPSYEHWPTPADQINDWPDMMTMTGCATSIQQYHAQDLEVLNADRDWRAPPYKLRAADGQVFYFVACQKSAQNVSRGMHIADSMLPI